MPSKLQQAWNKLETAKETLQGITIKELFAQNSNRFAEFSMPLEELLFDYSKNAFTQDTLSNLIELAKASKVEDRRSAMFAGEHINCTEDRAALHTALRSNKRSLYSEEVLLNRSAMFTFAEKIRDGDLKGATGKAFTDVVNIGIGGSDLGPAMVTIALAPYHDGPKCHFVSNIDGSHISDTLKALNPETTLFIIASKTFTTHETMTNAHSAMKWLTNALGNGAIALHFSALSAAPDRANAFGVRPDYTFGFQDWVGGRYSIWSSVGLSVAIAIGCDNFNCLLDGAGAVDEHFVTAPLGENIPVLMALIGVWNRNILGYGAQAILPYDQRLSRFSAYLQQLDMESNGKRVTTKGAPIEYDTGPLIWGEPGTNGQHAFYQWLHQGTDIVPADFLIAAKPINSDINHHNVLLANCFAQSEALAVGRDLEATKDVLISKGYSAEKVEQLAPHQVFPGNRPSNTILYDQLSPKVLGMLIALYEHKVFVQGVIWQINSFDQWGVELGKELASSLLVNVQGNEVCTSISRGLINSLTDFKKLH